MADDRAAHAEKSAVCYALTQTSCTSPQPGTVTAVMARVTGAVVGLLALLCCVASAAGDGHLIDSDSVNCTGLSSLQHLSV